MLFLWFGFEFWLRFTLTWFFLPTFTTLGPLQLSLPLSLFLSLLCLQSFILKLLQQIIINLNTILFLFLWLLLQIIIWYRRHWDFWGVFRYRNRWFFGLWWFRIWVWLLLFFTWIFFFLFLWFLSWFWFFRRLFGFGLGFPSRFLRCFFLSKLFLFSAFSRLLLLLWTAFDLFLRLNLFFFLRWVNRLFWFWYRNSKYLGRIFTLWLFLFSFLSFQFGFSTIFKHDYFRLLFFLCLLWLRLTYFGTLLLIAWLCLFRNSCFRLRLLFILLASYLFFKLSNHFFILFDHL